MASIQKLLADGVLLRFLGGSATGIAAGLPTPAEWQPPAVATIRGTVAEEICQPGRRPAEVARPAVVRPHLRRPDPWRLAL